jgi:hypothetical protein
MTGNEDDNLKLTPEQELIVRDAFQDGATPNLSELTQKVFKNPSIDGRSKEGRAIKEYISEFQIGKVRVNVIKKMEPYALSEEQKEKIKEEYKKDGFTTLIFTRNLLNDQTISALHLEHRAVSEYVKSLHDQDDKKSLRISDSGEFETINYEPSSNFRRSEPPTEQYRPPATIVQVIARINKYLNYGWKEENLKRAQIKSVESLFSYLKIFRFLYQINNYSRQEDRELFEDAFIRYTHDKDDLTQEELDQFITLSNEVVIAADIQRRIEYLRMALDDMASESDGRKISMSLNEAINNAQTEYNQCISRQDKLYKSLTVNRSKRIEEKRNENASILNLVYAWKQEENRERMIALAERQREALKEEVEKLSSVDEFKAIIRGIDPKEIFNT